ncbi:MAG: hypothetical protein ACP5QG_05000 [candidate division WOR-3 bacterium]
MLVAFLLARTLVVNSDYQGVEMRLTSDTSLVVQGKHLYGETGDTVKVVAEGDLVISVPSAWGIAFSSESGSISLKSRTGQGPFPQFLTVVTVSGDLYMTGLFPTRLTFTSMTGDATLEGPVLGDDWTASEYNIQTASGRVDIKGAGQGVFWVNTLTGPVSLTLDSLPRRASYDFRTGTGPIRFAYRDTIIADNFTFQRDGFSVAARRIGFVEQEERGWLWKWGKAWSPLLVIDYNRVKGPELGMGVDLNLGGPDAHTASGGLSYAFAAKTPFWFIRVSPRFVTNPNFYIDLWAYDTIASFDAWTMGKYENALSALIFTEDARDYFARRGISVGARAVPSARLSASLTYEMSEIAPIEKVTDFGLLGPDFRSNPAADSGALRALRLGSTYRNPGVVLSIEYTYSLPDSFDLNQLAGVIRLTREGWSYIILARLCVGYSLANKPAPRPFLFGLGGVGTIPAYPYKYQEGDHAILWNLEYQMKLRHTGPLKRIMAFADVGKAWTGSFSADSLMVSLGAGFSVYGISARIAQDVIDIERPARFFVRLEQRF